MKTLLCISPHFPPSNAADMHRLRQSLPYFREFSWKPVVFAVDASFVEMNQEPLLLDSLPRDLELHFVKAYSTTWTRKIGLGNLGFRSLTQLKKAVDKYLQNNKVDLIYFSTTVFTVMSLGPHWKKKYGVPFVVDLQDPWRNDYYLSVQKDKRPNKFWFDYTQKKYLEAKTMPHTNGIISVSKGYIETMKARYPSLGSLNCLTLPFGAMESDMKIAMKVEPLPLGADTINILYVGRGGRDMQFSISALFAAFKKGLEIESSLYSKIRFFFHGTSYAADGQGEKTILPIAEQYNVDKFVVEETDRLPYFQSLRTLMSADILFIPGSVDSHYTASKIFPYIMAKRPLLAIFNENSNVIDILKSFQGREVVSFRNDDSIDDIVEKVFFSLDKIVRTIPYQLEIDTEKFIPYTAREMTKIQCQYFDEVLR